MKQKSGFTFVEQAIALVPEFEKLVRKPEQQVTLRGQSQSTLQNYIRRIALLVLRFEKLPEQIDPEEINEYLAALARDPKSPSRSSFKHMVYGLRFIKDRLFTLYSKQTISHLKYIALNPAGVVQHSLIAGSCRPLRVLFIGGSF